MLILDCFFTTDVGKIRKNNEDNFYLNGNYKRSPEVAEYEKGYLIYQGGLFAVCDGMGGEEYGERASLIAVKTLKEYQGKDFYKYADEYIYKANIKICELIEKNNGTRSGSTLALIYIYENKAVSYNIGDSRVYLFRKGKLSQISEDHTQVAQMVKMGVLTKEQALSHRDRHVLTQHLGIFQDELIISAHESGKFEIQNDDIILLCSDGLTDMLCDKEIENVLNMQGTSREFANKLKYRVLEKGGKDNVTVGIIKAISKKEGVIKRFWRSSKWI